MKRRSRWLLLPVLAALACSNAVTSTRRQLADLTLEGATVDEVIRALGGPSRGYALPQSGHPVLVYAARRTSRGRSVLAATGLMLSGMGSGLSGQPPMARQPAPGQLDIACEFHLEFGSDGRLASVTEHGDGC